MFGLTPEEEQTIILGPRRAATALRILRFAASQEGGVTSDECTVALGIPHESASTRYTDLVRAGCLVRTKGTRRTRNGGIARVHKISPKADFHRFLILRRRQKKRSGLSPVERNVLEAGLAFLTKWRRAKSQKGRENAAVDLMNRLGKLAERRIGR